MSSKLVIYLNKLPKILTDLNISFRKVVNAPVRAAYLNLSNHSVYEMCQYDTGANQSSKICYTFCYFILDRSIKI